MRSLLVVMLAPDSAYMIEMLFGDDDELVQALELQRLNEAFHMGSEVRRHRGVSFHNGPTGFQYFIELATKLSVVIAQNEFRRHTHVFGDHQKIPGLQA